MLASHSIDEAKRYSSNTCYELRDDTAIPLRLVSILLVVACFAAQAVAITFAATEIICCYMGAMIQRSVTTTAPHMAV
jgi:hypothetical protein